MNIRIFSLLGILPVLVLAGCSGTASSSSDASSSRNTPQVTYPSTDAIKTAVHKATKTDQTDLIEAMEKDASVRFGDVIHSSNADKYAGKVKLVDGKVFDIENTKSKDGKLYYIEDITNTDHVYVLYTNRSGVRKDDSLYTYGVIAGKMTYHNEDNDVVKAVMVTAKKSNVQNNGATGK